ncbi:protein of unknown function [Candidatus Methylomirabilis oxygeniifera]|uniref:Uncharacterized protein n=1 Tax=Methylomirabilis oxygeniifera TaxID=671143 RepID=D5MII1_METO1|nr:protein of unknown function [Candidatus Methylomirabilis oxyfera]
MDFTVILNCQSSNFHSSTFSLSLKYLSSSAMPGALTAAWLHVTNLRALLRWIATEG